MIKIAHRGNVYGPNERENTLEYIFETINKTPLNIPQYDVEIDLWVKDGNFYLGHDNPIEEINVNNLKNIEDRLWVHCKNVEAYVALKDNFNCFMHTGYLYTVTSRGYLWSFPTEFKLSEKMIIMENDLSKITGLMKHNCVGICSDYIGQL